MKAPDQLVAASRDRQLHFMASAIHELTVYSRMFYDQPEMRDRMVRANEAIHRISGHLRDLSDPEEPMTLSRALGVLGNMEVLGIETITRIEAYSPL